MTSSIDQTGSGHTPGPWLDWATLDWLIEPHRLLESTENARLIAAAPELLEAWARLLAVFDQQRMTAAERIIVGISDAGLRTEGNAAIEALRAAIAKATGLAGSF